MSTLEELTNQRTAFVDERRFRKSGGLFASVSFSPLPLPPNSDFCTRLRFRAAILVTQLTQNPFFSVPRERNACYAGYVFRNGGR